MNVVSSTGNLLKSDIFKFTFTQRVRERTFLNTQVQYCENKCTSCKVPYYIITPWSHYTCSFQGVVVLNISCKMFCYYNKFYWLLRLLLCWNFTFILIPHGTIHIMNNTDKNNYLLNPPHNVSHYIKSVLWFDLFSHLKCRNGKTITCEGPAWRCIQSVCRMRSMAWRFQRPLSKSWMELITLWEYSNCHWQ